MKIDLTKGLHLKKKRIGEEKEECPPRYISTLSYKGASLILGSAVPVFSSDMSVVLRTLDVCAFIFLEQELGSFGCEVRQRCLYSVTTKGIKTK